MLYGLSWRNTEWRSIDGGKLVPTVVEVSRPQWLNLVDGPWGRDITTWWTHKKQQSGRIFWAKSLSSCKCQKMFWKVLQIGRYQPQPRPRLSTETEASCIWRSTCVTSERLHPTASGCPSWLQGFLFQLGICTVKFVPKASLDFEDTFHPPLFCRIWG